MHPQSKRSDWYRDNYKSHKSPRTDRAPKKRRWPIAVLIVILAASLLTGGALLIRHIRIVPVSTPSPVTPPQGGTIPGFELPDIFSGYYQQETETQPSRIERSRPRGDFTLPLVTSRQREELSLQQLYIDCAPGIVSIEASPKGGGLYTGSGIILSADGYILTNQHVIADTDSAEVILSDGTAYDALLVGEDRETDLAVLKIKAKDLPAAEFGDSGELLVGDSVAAIGSPLGSELRGTMTTGIISAINRNMDMNGRRMTLLQHSAAINSGSSGGALINSFGQVIGVTNMKLVATYSTATVEGLSFAIPSSTVKTVVDNIIANGKVVGRPGIGISVGAVTDEMREELGCPDGLYIAEIVENSDAAAQDILVGDILLEVNGKPVRESDDLLDIRNECEVGDTLDFLIWREGKTHKVQVRIVDLSDIY